MDMQQFEFRESESLIVRSRSSNSHSSRRRRLSSSMTMDWARLPPDPSAFAMWSGIGEDLLPSLAGVSGGDRVRTITNDLDVCALFESHTQRAILEDCQWNAALQPTRINTLVDSSPLIGFDSPQKPLHSRESTRTTILSESSSVNSGEIKSEQMEPTTTTSQRIHDWDPDLYSPGGVEFVQPTDSETRSAPDVTDSGESTQPAVPPKRQRIQAPESSTLISKADEPLPRIEQPAELAPAAPTATCKVEEPVAAPRSAQVVLPRRSALEADRESDWCVSRSEERERERERAERSRYAHLSGPLSFFHSMSVARSLHHRRRSSAFVSSSLLGALDDVTPRKSSDIEKRRREEMNEALQRLKSLIPEAQLHSRGAVSASDEGGWSGARKPHARIPMIHILQACALYCRRITHEDRKLAEQRRRMQMDNERLLARLRELQTSGTPPSPT